MPICTINPEVEWLFVAMEEDPPLTKAEAERVIEKRKELYRQSASGKDNAEQITKPIIKMEQTFTETDLVKFGNYLLSTERKKHFDRDAIARGLHKQVNHADFENWKAEQKQEVAINA
jgi:hypothetical protein